MKIYCSHSNKKFHKASNFYQCHSCTAGWYKNDSTPMIVIGYTEQSEVDVNYESHHKVKDLSKKNFVRCPVCKDLLEKRKHILCTFKAFRKRIYKRHSESFDTMFRVIKGFKK